MPEPQYTRCPACKTVFRVTDEQLAMRQGRVRCGHCKTVFDGRAELVRITEPPPEHGYDEITHGPPTMTLRVAHEGAAAQPEFVTRIAPAEAPPAASVETWAET